MITDNVIKQQFIIDKLKDAARFAFNIQLKNARGRLKSRSGNTFSALQNPNFTIMASGSRFVLTATVTKQLRFQDMGVRSLYTKPLFGSLKHTYGQLRYGFHDEIKEKIGEQLKNAVNQE